MSGAINVDTNKTYSDREMDAVDGLLRLGGGALKRRSGNSSMTEYGLGHKSSITMNDIHHHLREINSKANELVRNPANSRKPNHNAHALMMRHHFDFEKSHGTKGGSMDESGVVGGGFNPASLLPLLAFL